MSRYKGNTTVQLDKAQRSLFDLTYNRRMSLKMGELTVINCEELLPGDSVRASTEFLLRLMPTLAPIFDTIQVKVFHHFVPIRLIWKESKEFFTGGREGHGSTEEPIPPYMKAHTMLGDGESGNKTGNGSLADMLKIPNLLEQGSLIDWTTASVDINMLPFLAYQKIWIDWYMNSNLEDEEDLDFVLPALSGLQALSTILDTRYIEFTKDRFTSAMLEPQRGAEVLMPLAGTGFANYMAISELKDSVTGNNVPVNNPIGTNAVAAGSLAYNLGGAPLQARVENIEDIELDESTVSLNDFRMAWMLQKWYERANVGGHRYEDMMWAMFQVRPQDYRTQRSEFITGGIVPVKISEIVSTAYSENQDAQVVPVGNLSGHGITYGSDNRAKYYAHEHGYFFSLMVIVPKATYFQGLPKMFTRKTWMDWPWPQFGNLGEQPVYDYELYANPENLTQDEVGEFSIFGYQSVYSDWKQRQDHNSGDFRGNLLYWTLARYFEDTPVLDPVFTRVIPSIQDQIFTVAGQNNFLVYLTNIFTVKRALPYYGKPF